MIKRTSVEIRVAGNNYVKSQKSRRHCAQRRFGRKLWSRIKVPGSRNWWRMSFSSSLRFFGNEFARTVKIVETFAFSFAEHSMNKSPCWLAYVCAVWTNIQQMTRQRAQKLKTQNSQTLRSPFLEHITALSHTFRTHNRVLQKTLRRQDKFHVFNPDF